MHDPRARDYTRARVRQRLAELDRPPVWLANVLQIDLALVSRWLSGKQPIAEARLREIAIALHRPVEWFTSPPTEEAAV